MNHKKLPDLTVNSSFSYPKIKERANTLVTFLKYFLVILVTFLFVTGVFYLNLKLQTESLAEERAKIEQQKAFDLKPGIVLDTTAAIIAEEGKLPLGVAKKYAQWVYEAGYKYSIDPILILAVIHTESKFNYKAISRTGPIGLMQIASSFHKDKTTRIALFDPRNNIMVGAQILSEYSARSTNTVSTLLMYNGSLGKAPVYATKVLKKKMYYDNKILEAISL